MTGLIGILGYVALWFAIQLPVAILLGRCLRRASEQDAPEIAEDAIRTSLAPIRDLPRQRRERSPRKSTFGPDFAIGGYPVLACRLSRDDAQRLPGRPARIDW